MYNYYELLWLWYYYHSEKVDALVGEVRSRFDEDSYVPISPTSRKVSYEHISNLRNIMNKMCDGYTGELNRYKDTFSHYKTKGIYNLYEHLDKQGEFQFIHDFVSRNLNKGNKKQEDYKISFFD